MHTHLRTYILLALSCLALNAVAAPTLPHQDLGAVISYETQAVSSEGVHKTLRYRDRFYRTTDHVWLERILPAAHDEHEHENHAGHAHGDGHHRLDLHDINFETAAKFVSRPKQADSQASIRYISREKELDIEVEAENYRTVGFNGSWDAAYYLIDPASLDRLKPSRRPAPAQARWYEGGDKESYLRVLWQERKGFPLRIESGRKDGSLRRVVDITLRELPARGKLPWQNITGFTRKDYNDLMD